MRCEERVISVDTEQYLSSSTRLQQQCVSMGVTLSTYKCVPLFHQLLCMWQGAVWEQEFLVYAAPRMNEWIYTYLVRYPHTGRPDSQPWGIKIDMAFPKELGILWLCPWSLPPVLVSSTWQPWCPSVLFIYLCMETAVVFYGVLCCLLSSLPTDCCS